jgi:hypothetical protein
VSLQDEDGAKAAGPPAFGAMRVKEIGPASGAKVGHLYSFDSGCGQAAGVAQGQIEETFAISTGDWPQEFIRLGKCPIHGRENRLADFVATGADGRANGGN